MILALVFACENQTDTPRNENVTLIAQHKLTPGGHTWYRYVTGKLDSTAVVGELYTDTVNFTFDSIAGPWSVLPSWLTLDDETMILSGTPTMADTGKSDLLHIWARNAALWREEAVTHTYIDVSEPAPFDITEDGGVASASINSAWAHRAFDNLIGWDYSVDYKPHWWNVNGIISGWIKYKPTHSYIVDSYSITGHGGNPANFSVSKNPKDWVFQGSNNDFTWVTLDSRSNEMFDQNSPKRVFQTNNYKPKAYKYYRLHVYRSNGTATTIQEMEIFGTKQ